MRNKAATAAAPVERRHKRPAQTILLLKGRSMQGLPDLDITGRGTLTGCKSAVHVGFRASQSPQAPVGDLTYISRRHLPQSTPPPVILAGPRVRFASKKQF
ncbi:hypothetical protein CTheo_4382 [Ceratobasidium theobromae]|uniref:Uncharacterized protein n=1 Tax=Ceratobasidium theobromae TaxID=1582974 RepID=A0A5N5QKL6_9AGAM|nr:hypothetical protein CTheo_4382 [Ceratobasidium theobromae]